MGKIYVSSCGSLSGQCFKAATTKAGLAKLLGVSSDTVRRNLGKFITADGVVHYVAEVDLEKVGGKRGKVGGGTSGFLGMKGKDGMLKDLE